MTIKKRDSLRAELIKAVGAIVQAVRGELFAALQRRDAQSEDLNQRIGAIEARGELAYCGVWQDAKGYRRGNFVTHKGALWHCNAHETDAHDDAPGVSDVWQLAVKSGKDKLPQTDFGSATVTIIADAAELHKTLDEAEQRINRMVARMTLTLSPMLQAHAEKMKELFGSVEQC